MNGLLGSVDDPRTAGLLGLGLRLMSTPGKFGQALGQSGLGAMGDMRQAQAAQDQRKRAGLQEQLTMLQLAQAKAQQEQMAQQQAQQQAIAQAYRGAIESPAQQALAGGGGPTVANAQAMQGMQPRLNQSRLIEGLTQADPMTAAKMLQPQPDELMTVAPGASVLSKRDPTKALYTAPKEDATPSDWKLYQLSGAAQRGMSFDQWDLARRRATASNTSVSYGAPVQGIDMQGNPVFLQPTKDGSPPNIIPGVRPPKSGAEEKAEGEKATRERQGKQMMSVMEDARAILQGGKATASGIGTVVDAGARVIGKTTAGAQDAARLSALSGWLVANVPRMEGPQSNYDVQNYMTMAGKVGDSTVPIPERLAALAEVEKLQRKYAEVNGTPLPAARKPAASLDDLLNKYGN